MSMNPLKTNSSSPEKSQLGQKTIYEQTYSSKHLYPISRIEKRQEIGIDPDALPFHGFDCWTHYEVSWLNLKGKPMVAIAEIIYDCRSPYIVESKSLKLYFNSLNNSSFASREAVEQVIQRDLQTCLHSSVVVKLSPLNTSEYAVCDTSFSGESLDDLDVHCSVYSVEPAYLITSDELVEETLFSDLLKSNCLVTNQPDWGSVQITYCGKKINREGLLKYLVSFRNHNEFHEQCIERIFIDILQKCQPTSLTIYGRYTRRGGLDINPYRSTEPECRQDHRRLIRQ